MEKPIICTANQNGSQADCELGNPFKRDSKVKTCFTCSSWLLKSLYFRCERCFFLPFLAPGYILHHPEHCGYDSRHHRDRHRPAAPNVRTAAFFLYFFRYISININKTIAPYLCFVFLSEQVCKKILSLLKWRLKLSLSCRCQSVGKCVKLLSDYRRIYSASNSMWNTYVFLVYIREASPNQVSFGGVVKGESAMKTEEEIGSLITYKFRVSSFIFFYVWFLNHCWLSFDSLSIWSRNILIFPSDKQLVEVFEVFCQSLTSHSVAQI